MTRESVQCAGRGEEWRQTQEGKGRRRHIYRLLENTLVLEDMDCRLGRLPSE